MEQKIEVALSCTPRLGMTIAFMAALMEAVGGLLLIVGAPTTVHLELDQLLNQMDRTTSRQAELSPGFALQAASVPHIPVTQQQPSLLVFGGIF